MDFIGKLLSKKKNRKTSYDVNSISKIENEKLEPNKKSKEPENLSGVIRVFSNYFKVCKVCNQNDDKAAKNYGEQYDSKTKEFLNENESLLVDFEIPEPDYEVQRPVISVAAEVYNNEPKEVDKPTDGICVEKFDNLFVPVYQKPFMDIPIVYRNKRD